MIDFSLLIARLGKSLKTPEDFTLPIMHETSGNYSKSELNERIYHNAKCYFSMGSVIEIYQYTQKKFLIESLTWAEDQYSKGNTPLLSYSLRVFLESSANYHAGINKIETTFSLHNSIEKDEEAWTKSIKENIYDSVISLIMPITLKLDGDEIPANSGTPDDQEQKILKIRKDDQQYFEFTGNHSLSSTKASPLKPNNILTNLKKFEKAVDGIHQSYDLLSEIMHPNSYPSTSQMNLFYDVEDASKPLVFWKFKNSVCPPPEFFYVDKITPVIHECANAILKQEQILPKISSKIQREVKQNVRPLIKAAGLGEDSRYGRSLCLCGSRKKLKTCCGKVR
jgi:hypothetical protein